MESCGGVGEESGLENFDLPDKILEGLIGDAHVVDGIENRDAVGEPSLHLFDVLPSGISLLSRLHVLGKEYPQTGDTLEARQ